MRLEGIRVSCESAATDERPRLARVLKICLIVCQSSEPLNPDRRISYCCKFSIGILHEQAAQLYQSLHDVSVAFGRRVGATSSTCDMVVSVEAGGRGCGFGRGDRLYTLTVESARCYLWWCWFNMERPVKRVLYVSVAYCRNKNSSPVMVNPKSFHLVLREEFKGRWQSRRQDPHPEASSSFALRRLQTSGPLPLCNPIGTPTLLFCSWPPISRMFSRTAIGRQAQTAARRAWQHQTRGLAEPASGERRMHNVKHAKTYSSQAPSSTRRARRKVSSSPHERLPAPLRPSPSSRMPEPDSNLFRVLRRDWIDTHSR
jgi:hypothetical protein